MVKIFTGILYSCPCGYETLSAAGCMESHKEMIFNIKTARRVFYEFIEM